jgi:hypothetical protein
VQYTPASGYIGTDSFEYIATDENGTSKPATVTIRVGNHAPTATDDAITAQLGRSLTISAADLLTNDTDGDADPLTVVGAYLTSGTVKDIAFDAKTGDVTLASATAGNVAIEYLVSDGRAAPVAATVTVTFKPGAASGGRNDNGTDNNGNAPSGSDDSTTTTSSGTPPTEVLGIQMAKEPTLPLTGAPMRGLLLTSVVLMAAGAALTLARRRHRAG